MKEKSIISLMTKLSGTTIFTLTNSFFAREIVVPTQARKKVVLSTLFEIE